MRHIPGLAIAILFLVGAELAAAQECERLPPAPGSTGYQSRRGSDRCEGIYVSPVSGGGMQLVSLTFGRIHFDNERDATLFVQPPRETSGRLRLQGVGIPIGLYYRLDADLAPGRDFLLPLTTVIRPNRMSAGDLGLFAWRDGGGGRRVYLPVQVATDPRSFVAAGDMTAIMRPDSDIQNLRWRLTPAGATAASEFQALASAQGPVPSGNRLEITLPRWNPAGEAMLELRYVDLAGRERSSRFQIATR